MSADLWLGATTTLAGAALGGTISLLLNRQQMKDARQRRSIDRRFDAYAAFFTEARSYRTALRPFAERSDSKISVEAMDELAHAADSASSLVFIMLESEKTYHACRHIVSTIYKIQKVIHKGTQLTTNEWLDRNDRLAQLLREFQVAIREELDVSGVQESLILSRNDR